ncbi:GTA head formation protein, RCAP_rcc01685 family [Pseudoroseicyclus sp. H15]
MGEERPWAEPFACGPGLKIEAYERLSALQFAQMSEHLSRIEAAMERLERRLWLTVYGVLGTILAQAFLQIMERMGDGTGA